MLPLSSWPAAERSQIIGVFTDIDDTLTTDGAISPDALQALAQLKAAGLTVIAITGRPVGWCERLAATWPVDAIVAENGAVALVRDRSFDKNGLQPPSNIPIPLSKLYQLDTLTRATNQARMQQIGTRVMFQVPGVLTTRDSEGRETDLPDRFSRPRNRSLAVKMTYWLAR